jgi:hypothetical protein
MSDNRDELHPREAAGVGCGADFDPVAYPCTCWKADVL